VKKLSKNEPRNQGIADIKIPPDVVPNDMTPAEHFQVYCAPVFRRHDEKISHLIQVVEDGLTERTKRIEKLLYALMLALIIESVVSRFF